MSGRLVVVVDVRTKSPNALHNEHPLARSSRRRREGEATRLAWYAALARGGAVPPGPWVCTFVRVSAALVDTDNLSGASKRLRDEVARLLGITDGPRDVRCEWRYRQEATRVPCIIIERGRRRAAFKSWVRIELETRAEPMPTVPE